MKPCPLCGHKRSPTIAPILALVALLIAGGLFVWQARTTDDSRHQETIAQLRERISSLEARGQGTVIFHFPEARGVPYVNVDQKGFDLALPTPVPISNGKRTPVASTESRKEISKTR